MIDKVQAMFLTTDLRHRQMTADKAWDCLCNAGCDFDKKVITEDHIESKVGLGFNASYMPQKFLVYGDCTGHRAMVNNMYRGIQYLDDDALLVYCEDHIFIKELPPKHTLDLIFKSQNIRWLCLNTHVHEENLCNVPGFVERPGREFKLKYIQSPLNWIECGSKYSILLKGVVIADEYWLNFPVAITPVKIFRDLLYYGMENYNDVGVEIGFTRAWRDLGYDERYKVGILTQKVNCSKLSNFKDLHDFALMRFRNNDSSMMHDSVVDHKDLPKNDNDKRAFF